MFNLARYLASYKEWVDAALDKSMPSESARPEALHKAMRYSVFAGGKRLRPILCLAAAEACGGTVEQARLPALSLEVLHTYTLIHDDLPCMDDDSLRRGRPTCHIAFGEALALLAGDALLTLAFEWLGDAAAPPPHPPGALVRELAEAAGSRGVIGGQVEDLAAEGAEPSAERVEYIHAHKTGALIRAAVRMGAIAAGAAAADLDALTRYGERVGRAFQAADDILNATASPEELGKPAGTDVARRKLTYVRVHGIELAKTKAADFVREAVSALRPFGDRAEPLAALARHAIERTN